MFAGLGFFSKASGYTPLNLLVSVKMTRMTKLKPGVWTKWLTKTTCTMRFILQQNPAFPIFTELTN